MVTLFQVLEHVSAPVSFLEQAAQITAPGGYLVVAVPYDSGVNRLAGMVPHQWPPHHLTRWRHCDIQALGKKLGLKTVSQKSNTLVGSELRRYLRLDRRLRKALPNPRPAMPSSLITALGWFYTLTGGPFIWPRLGANTTTIFQKL
jgi:SAM-dependent methyltransferase